MELPVVLPVQHRAGVANSYADHLSRIASDPCGPFPTIWDAVERRTPRPDRPIDPSTEILRIRPGPYPRWVTECIDAGASIDWIVRALDYTFNVKKERPVRAALSNTFGFGGHNASVIVRKFG